MGIHDRQYYRDDEPGGFHLHGTRMMVTNLVIVNAAFFLLNFFIAGNRGNWLTAQYFALSPDTLVKPWLWWQFVTTGFTHSPTDIWHLLFNMFALWMFGREVEGVYGPKEVLRIYLVVVVLGALIWALRMYFTVDPSGWGILLGASGAVSAFVLLFVLHFPNRTILLMFVLPVPAWVLGLLIIGYNIVGLRSVAGGGGVAYDVHLVGIAFAVAYFRFHWNLGRWLPSDVPDPTKWLRRRPKLKLHAPERDYSRLDEEADRILDKVHREGEESLTAKERQTLEDYSRRMRQKRS